MKKERMNDMKTKIKLKYVIPIAIAALIAASIPTVSSFAEKKGEELIDENAFLQKNIDIENKNTLSEYEQQEERENYLLLAGNIKSIRNNQEDTTFAHISDSDEPLSGIHFGISKDTLLFDQTGAKVTPDSLQTGDTVKVYYRKDQPMALSMPPMTFAPILIVEKENSIGFIELAFFNENLINLENTLKLNISDETQIIDEQGNKRSKDDLYNQELLVFYDITTRSIPAQTSPSKIIILPKKEQLKDPTIEEINKVIDDDFIMINNQKMIPLRKVAEHLGYKVNWIEESEQIELWLQNSSFTLTIGEKSFGYNRSLRYFEQAPILQNQRTYVPESFINDLIH